MIWVWLKQLLCTLRGHGLPHAGYENIAAYSNRSMVGRCKRCGKLVDIA